jgi:hypothetical protein
MGSALKPTPPYSQHLVQTRSPIVGGPSEECRFGSGYLVDQHHVLTCAHGLNSSPFKDDYQITDNEDGGGEAEGGVAAVFSSVGVAQETGSGFELPVARAAGQADR